MNRIPSYSMWWILIHRAWYWQNGDLAYLRRQRDYLLPLLRQLAGIIGADGLLKVPTKFVDWSSPENEPAKDAILHSILMLALRAGSELCTVLGEREAAELAVTAADGLHQICGGGQLDPGGSKQAAALLAVAGLADPAAINREILAVDGARGLSAFLGYFVLQARAKAGDIAGSLQMIRDYWGGMLQMGATSFWEEFNVDWMNNAARIDELPAAGQSDIHGDTGGYCFSGFRKSLCHGWAAGPTPWLSEHILGIRVLDPGCRRVLVAPDLGDLTWAEGSFPTPLGPIRVRHRRQASGRTVSSIQAPEGITILRPGQYKEPGRENK